MRKLLMLGGAFLCLSLTASAQDSTAALDAGSSAGEPAAPVSLSSLDRESWQLGLGFQYQHYKVLGQSFHDLGYNADLTYYLNNWFGVEGTAAMGFGHTGTKPINFDAKSLFVGGGPHVAFSNKSRFEPWVHVLAGMEHFRFTQTSKVLGLGSNTALGFMAGGGVDYRFGGRATWRIQADYIGSHFQSNTQSNYSVGTGIVFNF